LTTIVLDDLWKYDPATNNWTRMKGSSTVNQAGTYGTLGIQAPGNAPGARKKALAWSDPAGNLWLFGGYGFGASGREGNLNDLWKYNPASNCWTWMKGAATPNSSGILGVLATPAPDNTPGARSGAVSWIDSSGNFWLFGGDGRDCTGLVSYQNDLWRGSYVAKASQPWQLYR
jgi:hypothetical protein